MDLGDLFRAITRPIVTILFAFALVWIVIEGLDAPQWFLALAGSEITEWCGERIVKHVKETKEVKVED